MKYGYVITNEAVAVTANDFTFVYAPCRVVEDAFGRVDVLDSHYYVATDGNTIAVLNAIPDFNHPVWEDSATNVVSGCVWPYLNIVEALNGDDFSCIADPLFSCAATAAVLFSAAVGDPTAWQYLVTSEC